MLDEKIFFKVVEILNRVNIDWWLDHGTLLGYVRDGAPIEWDRDFDIGTSASINDLIDMVLPEIEENFSNVYIDSMSNALKIQFFEVDEGSWAIDIASYRFQDGWAVKCWPNLVRASLLKKTLALAISTLCGRVEVNSNKLTTRVIASIFKMLRRVIESTMNKKTRHKFLSKFSCALPYVKNSVSSELLAHTKKIEIKGVEVRIPSNCDQYLTKRYGEDWRIPKKKWNYLTDDGGLL